MEAWDEGATRATNLACLDSLHPGLSASLVASHAPHGDMARVVGPSGEISARISGHTLHSPRRPRDEARRLVESAIDPTSAGCVVFAGFGLGYAVEEYLRLSPAGTAVVVEPDVPAFLAAVGFREMGAIFGSGRVSYLVGGPAEAIIPILSSQGPVHVSVIPLRAVYDRHRDYFRRLGEVIESFTTRSEVNRNTLIRFSRLWVRNLLRNLGTIERAGEVASLEDSMNGLPGLLVGGGPTVDEVAPRLRDLAEYCVVVAVDTGLVACLRAGVAPDFLVVVDPQYWNTRHIDFALWHGAAGDRTILVSESSAHSRIFRNNVGPVYLCSSLFPLGTYLEARLGSFGRLGAGGSVSTTAWDFLRFLGCSPILYAGVDLGFPGRQTHFRGSFFEERIHTLSNRTAPAEHSLFRYLHDAGLFSLPNYDGATTLTDKRMSVYRWWFESQARDHPETRTRSLSTRSVKIDGFESTGLEQELDRLAKTSPGREEIARRRGRIQAPLAGRDSVDRRESVVLALRQLTEELSSIREAASDGLQSVAKAREAISSTDRTEEAAAFAMLDAVDERIMAFPNRDILGFLLQKELYEVTSAGVGGRSDAGLMLENAEKLYRGLFASADYHLLHILPHVSGSTDSGV